MKYVYFLDGDDWLVNDNCLNILNKVYQNPNIHASFGSMENAPWQYRKWKKYKRLKINDEEGIYFPHLRTSRSYVAKRIPAYYMQDESHNWLRVCTDVGLFMAIVEAIGEDGYVFLKDVLVHYKIPLIMIIIHKRDMPSLKVVICVYIIEVVFRDKVPMKQIIQKVHITSTSNNVACTYRDCTNE